MRRTSLAALIALGAWLVTGSGATAQTEVTPFDSNTGYDHVSQPPPGALSSADWCFSFSDFSLVGDTIEVTANGPTGTVTGTGIVDADGSAVVRVGITQGGLYDVTSIRAVGGGATVNADAVASIDVVFVPDFVDCAAGLALAPPPAVVTTTVPAAAPPTTAAPAPTIQAVETAPTPPVVTTAEIGDPAPSDDSSTLPWVILSGGGLALLLGGGLIFFSPKGTMTRKRGDGTKTRDGEDEDDDDPRDAPTPVIYGEIEKPENYCDWAALYVNGSGKPTVLRETKGKRCCYYEISIKTVNSKFTSTDTESVHSGEAWILHRQRRAFRSWLAGVGTSVSSDAKWKGRDGKGRPKGMWKRDAPLSPTGIGGTSVTYVELRLVRNQHCTGSQAHEFETDTISSSGEARIDITCQHRLVDQGCDNSFSATFDELGIEVSGTDITTYNVDKAVAWSRTQAAGAGWTVEAIPITLGAETTVGAEFSKSLGPLGVKGGVSGGVKVNWNPGDDHNPPPAVVKLAGGQAGGGKGTFDPRYELTFAHGVAMTLSHVQQELDLTGSWDDYKSHVGASVSVVHDVAGHGETHPGQWSINHAKAPNCCLTPADEPCRCKPAMTFKIRGADTKPSSNRTGMVIADEWTTKGKVHDAVLEIDGKKTRLRAPKQLGETDWTVV